MRLFGRSGAELFFDGLFVLSLLIIVWLAFFAK